MSAKNMPPGGGELDVSDFQKALDGFADESARIMNIHFSEAKHRILSVCLTFTKSIKAAKDFERQLSELKKSHPVPPTTQKKKDDRKMIIRVQDTLFRSEDFRNARVEETKEFLGWNFLLRISVGGEIPNAFVFGFDSEEEARGELERIHSIVENQGVSEDKKA